MSLLALLAIYTRTPKALTERFKFEPYGGYYLDPRTGHAVCPQCLAEGRIVHMMEAHNARICNACRTACRSPVAKAD